MSLSPTPGVPRRVFWHRFLTAAASSPFQSFRGVPVSLVLALENGSSWEEVVSLLGTVSSAERRMETASSFALFYLWNGRLEESQSATDFWKSDAENWVREHREDAREALRFYQSQFFWYPQGFDELLPPNVPKPDLTNIREVVDVLQVPAPLRREMMLQWRDSRLMSEILDWIAQQQLQNNLEWPLRATSKEMRPLLPWKFDSVGAPRLLVQRTKMPVETFGRLWREATTLNIEENSRDFL